MDYQSALFDYRTIVLPKMYEAGYHHYPAKSPEYGYAEQSLLAHIMNGIYGFTTLCKYFEQKQMYSVNEQDYRRFLCLYTTHDLHKLVPGIQGTFDIPLERYQEEITKLDLGKIAATTPIEHRAASVHSSSSQSGDRKQCLLESHIDKLCNWVYIADALASMTDPAEYRHNDRNSLKKKLDDLSPSIAQDCDFYYHKISEYRGVSSNLLHQAVSQQLAEYQLSPLLYFPQGTLYLGPKNIRVPAVEELCKLIFAKFSDMILHSALNLDELGEIYNPKTGNFEVYAFLFADLAGLLEHLATKAIKNLKTTFVQEILEKRVAKRHDDGQPKYGYTTYAEFYQKYGIQESDATNPDFMEPWHAASKFIAGADSLARDFHEPEKEQRWPWLAQILGVPPTIAQTMVDNQGNFAEQDHTIPLAYHFLKNHQFGTRQDRSALSIPVDDMIAELKKLCQTALEPFVTQAKQKAYVNQSLDWTHEQERYLQETLQFNFCQRAAPDDPLEVYSKERNRAHKRYCAICNRVISPDMEAYTIKSEIFENDLKTFSNRLLPALKVSSSMVWCTICYMEFMLRKVTGLGYPAGADSGKSDRLFLYLLPDYSFSPDFLEDCTNIFQPFQKGTALKLRRYGKDDDPTLPEIIWENQPVFQKLRQKAMELFDKAAQRIQDLAQEWQKPYVGERIHTTMRIPQMNYQLLIFEHSAYQSAKEPIKRTELWAKTLYAGLILQSLLHVRVYISERPYLLFATSQDFQSTMYLDSPHQSMRGILPVPCSELRLKQPNQALNETQLNQTLRTLSAVWLINNWIGDADKAVALIFQEINRNPLAGASFYKKFFRDSTKGMADPLFTSACQYLLDTFGGLLMNLTRALAEKSMDMFLPNASLEGRTYRYERVFRLAIDSLKKNSNLSPEEMKDRLAGYLLQRLGKLPRNNGRVFFKTLSQNAMAYASLIVDELFVASCGSSLAQLNRQLNPLAGGIYFIIDQQVNERWASVKAKPQTDEEGEDQQLGENV